MTAEITIILLNYRRPQNIPIILESIRRQSVRPNVYLWNNGDVDVNLPGIDRYEKSNHNVGCMARWKLGQEAETPYVMSLDDDLCLARSDALADIISLLDGMDDPARIVGPTGCFFLDAPDYTQRKDIYARYARTDEVSATVSAGGYTEVDVVKGRSMALRHDQIAGLELPDEREDDIFLSAALAKGSRLFHRVPGQLDFAFRELPEQGLGNWRRPGHMESRIRATRTYFLSAADSSPSLRQETGLTLGNLHRGFAHDDWKPRTRGVIYEGPDDNVILQIDESNRAQLNKVAAFIWELCDGTRNQESILSELCARFDAPEDVLWADLGELLELLVKIGALESGQEGVKRLPAGRNGSLRIRLGLVAETRVGFLNQVKLCLYSLRRNGGALGNIPVTLITNCLPVSERDATFMKENFAPIDFVTSPRLGAIPHTSKLNVFYSIDPSTYDVLMFMDCDTVVRRPLDQIADPFIYDKGVDFLCRRGGETDRNSFLDFDSMVERFCGDVHSRKIVHEGEEEWPMFNTGVFLATAEAVRRIRRNSIEFTYQIFNDWQRTDALERLPEHIRKQIDYRKELTASWPIEQGAVALACIKSGIGIRYLDGSYNSWGGEEDFRILHCFKSLYKFNRPLMFEEESEKWLAEYRQSDIPGKKFLAEIVQEYKTGFAGEKVG